MEITIGLQNLAKTLTLDLDLDAEQLQETLHRGLSHPEELLSLTDTKGRKYLINPKLLAYCEINTSPQVRVGFGIG